MSRTRKIRWWWALFGVLLVIGFVCFLWTADWQTETWLDLAAIVVSPIATIGVLLYAFSVAKRAPVFWRWFRWLFAGVATAQALNHAWWVAGAHGYYSGINAILFLLGVALLLGPIILLQWIAMSRLAHTEAP
jgi:hypothetical protein